MDHTEPIRAAAPGRPAGAARRRHWLIRLLSALTLAQVGFGLLLAALNQLAIERLFAEYVVSQALASLACAAVGALVATRQPANTVGWLLVINGVFNGMGTWVGQYARYALVTAPGSLPAGELVAALNFWLFGPIVALSAIFLPLLFPDGRLPSPRWRLLAGLAIGATVLFTLSQALTPGAVDASLPEVDNPFAPAGMEAVRQIVDPLALALLLISLAGAVSAVVVRFRHAAAAKRQQIKWFAYAVVLLVAALLTPAIINPFGFADPAGSTLLSGILMAIALPLIPTSVGIAILRYRLWDIDLLISRTLVYGALTTCVVGVYVIVVGYLGVLFRSSGSIAIELAATGVVAVLFQPLRDRLQRSVNRLFYGERDDPYTVIAQLGQRLEASLAPETVLPTIAETVAHALKLPYAAIELPREQGALVAAEYGQPQPHLTRVTLSNQGEMVGQLLLAPRAPGEAFTPADRALLDVLAGQAGVAVHAAQLTNALRQLTSDLQHSREQLVTSREEERRRIRRDLHDGIGPTLASLVQRLDAARASVGRNPDAAVTMLHDLKAQVKDTIADIRRLVDALRPPILDQFGLVPALRAHAERVSQPGALQVVIQAPPALPALPAAVEVAAYRIVMEALTNVVRHAAAHSCTVRLWITDDHTLTVDVTDDGTQTGAGSRAGVGLQSMRERAAELGGSCTITIAHGGTQVHAVLPLTVGT